MQSAGKQYSFSAKCFVSAEHRKENVYYDSFWNSQETDSFMPSFRCLVGMCIAASDSMRRGWCGRREPTGQ